jgi:putative protease
MKLVTYAENLQQLKVLHSFVEKNIINNIDLEVIVGLNAVSRYSENSLSDLHEMIRENQKLKLQLVLEWDVLKQENQFKKSVEIIKELPLHEFIAIRLQDPGAVNYVKEYFPWLKVQLILENGNHNLVGLSRWKAFLGEQLSRLILSNELSKEHLRLYCQELDVDIEVLTFGRILLFYSPRLLLSPLEKNNINESLVQKNIEAFGTSEESPHAGFPLIENQHGTFMFNVKDLYLLEHLNELKELKAGAVRIDLRFDKSFQYLENIVRLYGNEIEHDELLEIKNKLPRPVIKGFYNINKTDVLFTKLKNKRIQRLDSNYIGEIVDVERDHKMALMIKSNGLTLKIGDEIQLVTPEGKIKHLKISTMTDSCNEEKNTASINQLILLPFMSGVVAKTQVYLK